MRALRNLIVIAAAASLLAGCAAVTSAPAGPYKVGAAEVTLGREWSDISAIMVGRPKKVRLLSLDGPLLNRLYVTDGLAPGEFLVKPAAKEKPTPTYKAGMSASERMEFVADSVAALDYQRVEVLRPRPAKFGEAPGLRFDLRARSPDGLDIAGTALVAEIGTKLYVVLYLAPDEHYFAAHLSDVEAVISSARPGA